MYDAISDAVQFTAMQIGNFYLDEFNGDYDAATEHIIKIRINRISVEHKTVEIETSRPGFLIGRRGETIEKLEKYLGKKVILKETKQHLLDFLIPVNVDEYLDYDCIGEMNLSYEDD
jgi:predicted RNA-binding protein Jag